MKQKKISTKLGETLAYLQDSVDRLLTFGFEKLSKSGKQQVKKNDHVLKKGWIKTADFLGDMGTSFYEKYTKIKEERSAKASKSNSKK